MELSKDHVPPRQFYLKQIRETQNPNLYVAPSHKKCNEEYKEDEEYFYLSLYPVVAKNNPLLEDLYFQDIQRRSQQPQTPAKLREILSTAVTITEAGIYLPNGIRQISIDRKRIVRIITKIARGILFLSTKKYFEEHEIINIVFCDDSSKIIEPYKEVLRIQPFAGVCPDVFAHSHINHQSKSTRILLMLFWKAFMVVVIVKDGKSEEKKL